MQNILLYPPFLSTPVLAQQEAPGGGGFDMLLIMLLFMAGMYFLLIAPQRKKQKEHNKMVAALKNGDRVLTAGGLQGVIANVKADRFTIKLNDDVRVELDRNFVHSKITQDAESDKAGQKNKK